MSSLIVSRSTNVNKQLQPLPLTCELCAVFTPKSIMIRQCCTIQCTYCNKNICSSCCASIAELPPHSQSYCNDNDETDTLQQYKLQTIKENICLQCIIEDRHELIMKSVYKSIGDILDINIINIIALFAIQECNECNKQYPKSWTIIQPDIMDKLVINFKPKCDIKSLFHNNINHNKYALRYCKSCNIEQERDIIFNAIYSTINNEDNFDWIDIIEIIDIITLYSIGSILICTNFNNCNNEIIIDNNFDGLIERKDMNGNKITRSNILDKIFCFQCTINENRCDGMIEYCSYCNKSMKFGHNITCNECLDRFCYECMENEDIECYIEKKYYFDIDGKMKYYQYCNQCTVWINDDIDIMDDDISSISFDECYQEMINDFDYTEYQLIDRAGICTSNSRDSGQITIEGFDILEISKWIPALLIDRYYYHNLPMIVM